MRHKKNTPPDLATGTGEIPPTEAPPAPAKKTRKPREKAVYLLEKFVDTDGAWHDAATGNTFADVPSALAYIEQNELEGSFRIIAVKKAVTATKVQKVCMQIK